PRRGCARNSAPGLNSIERDVDRARGRQMNGDLGKSVLWVVASAAAAGALSASGPATAADWVMLQAMEPPATTHKVFGVAQASYTNFFGCDKLEGLRDVGPNPFSLLNGSYNGNCRVGPELRDRQSDFNLDNLGIGLRGNLIPSRIN